MERGREKFQRYKPYISFLTKLFSIFPNRLLHKMLVGSRKWTGNVGLVYRYTLLKNLAKYIGENVSIHPNVYLFNVQNLSIGDNVSIHPMTYIEAYGGITIGSDVSIAHGATIMSVNHGFSVLEVPIKDQPIIPLPINIESNVWIGAKATILGGRTIHSGAIVGAGAVVTKDVEENTVVAGVPASTIKTRE